MADHRHVLTESRARALAILRGHGPIAPREFARLMWPDSPGWKRHSKCGPYGATQGGGMNLAGGAYLGRLRRAGLVDLVSREHYHEYRITRDGKRALEAAND